MGLNEPFFNHSSDVVFTAQEGGIAYLSCEVMIMMIIVTPVTMVTVMAMMVITANEGRIAYLSCDDDVDDDVDNDNDAYDDDGGTAFLFSEHTVPAQKSNISKKMIVGVSLTFSFLKIILFARLSYYFLPHIRLTDYSVQV